MAHNADIHLSVTSTVAALRTELPELEQHQMRLEAELAAVTGRLEAVRDALRALQSLSTAPLPRQTAGPAALSAPSAASATSATSATEPDGEQATASTKAVSPVEPRNAARRRAPAKTATTTKARKSADAKTADAKTATGVASQAVPARRRTPGLSAGVLAYLAEVKEPVRAAQVTRALGRETTPANVNAVRTSLERAVKASQAQRTGRGLYQALPR
ncbi:prephenate dehydrogenase [Kitasatospora sp. HPMI-4]|uniref:prephenate dehydrogenase n=1 Tax=Kitasatospora sp. HPMI-4 TaxID=3448443 RepID=UPI003F19938E